MSKLVIMPDNLSNIYKLMKKDINGFILSIENLSVNSSFYINLDMLKDIIEENKKYNKKIYISLNKNMFNSDLENLKNTLIRLNSMNIDMILFYDLSVLSICKELNIDIPLCIFQDHLNTSIYSHKFYNKRGVNCSFISSDITYREINDIKKSTNMSIFMYVYGYIPISDSRRYMITNYLDYIDKEKRDKYYYIKNDNDYYLIIEDKCGTTVYTKEKINLINEIKNIEKIDNYVINCLNTDYEEIENIIDSFNNKKLNRENNYIGFFDTETIYKVKNNG